MRIKKYSRLSIVLILIIFAFGSFTSAFGAATITINNINAAGVGFNDPTVVAPVGGNAGTTLGQQRLIAFTHAANIWGATLTSTQPIVINAQFTALTCTATSAVLGSAGPTSIFRDFANAPFAGTWYYPALADKLSGLNLSGAIDINANFNVNLGQPGCLTGTFFYLGLDNNHGTNTDFVTVLLHEMGHGLGSSTQTSGTTGAFNGGFPTIFDRFMLDNTTGKSWMSMTNAERAASALNTNNLSWNGPNVGADLPSVLTGSPILTVNSPAGIAGNYLLGAATFGPPITLAGTTGNIVLAIDPADGAGPLTTDGCSPFTNAAAIAGNIALIDRGTCGFVIKAANAQAAGAIAVIIADSVAGSPPPGLGGSDPSITIPAGRITLSDGNTIKAQLGVGVNAKLTLDPTNRPGSDAFGRTLLFTPSPFQSGSSVSHWSDIAFPNLLMEPSINADLSHNVTAPSDLTYSQMRDIGWESTSLPNTISKTSGDNQPTGQNQPYSVPISVTVSPAISGIIVNWKAVTSSGALGTFPSTSSTAATSVTDAAGVAIAPPLVANAVFGGFSLNATAPGAGTTTFTLLVDPPPAAGPFCITDTTQADFQAGVATNTDVAASPGNVVLLNPANVDQQNLTLGGSGNGITTTGWSGQTFVPSVTGQLAKADVSLFCSGCTGTTPTVTVSVRATSAGLPTGADLASATFATSTSGASAYYTANFAAPATLTAGTTYALVIRNATNPSVGTNAVTRSDTDVYASGARVTSANSGGTWTGQVTDIGFVTYMKSGNVSSGDFVSSAKDSNPPVAGTTVWSNIAWNATAPANTTLRFQAAGSNSFGGPFNFVGPDGTAGTFFTNGASLAQFNGLRYLKYKAFFTSTDPAATPSLSDVTICFVNRTPSAVNLTSSQNPSLSGQSVTFTATVAGIPPGATPTGTVNFLDGGNPIAGCQNVALAAGQAQCVTSALPVGNRTITADYSGDTDFTPGSGSLTGNPQVVNVCTPSSTVYVDDDWAGTPYGNDPDGAGPAVFFGCNSFATVQGGVTGVLSGGNVIVASGLYNESQVLITKAVTVTGAGAATTTINGGTAALASAGTIRIDLPLGVTGNVTFSGFTTVNPGVTGTRYHVFAKQLEPTSTITVSNNHMVGTVGGAPADYAFYAYQAQGPIVFNNNVLTNNTSNAILIENPIGGAASTDIHHNTVTGNAFTAVFAMAYGGNDVTALQRIANNTFDGAASSAISINGGFGGSTGKFTNVQVTDNVINSLGAAAATRVGISLNNGTSSLNQALGAIENPVISGNKITGTGAANSHGIRTRGLVINPTITGNDVRNLTRGIWGEVLGTGFVTGAQIHFNNLVDHTAGIQWDSPVAANAENNWWGCNAGPGNAGCSPVAGAGAGSVDFDPWIVLGISAVPSTINALATSAITADMSRNSNGALVGNTPPNVIPDTSIAWSAINGTMTPTSGTVISGTGASTFTSTSPFTNSASACADVDHQKVCTTITTIPQLIPTTIQITDTPDPSMLGEPYTVSWTVTHLGPGNLVPTGTVTVTDGTNSCTAPVAVGFCTLPSSTPGVTTLVATYSGDSVFLGSTSAGIQHSVVIRISGTIRQAPGMTPLAGVTVTLTGANGGAIALTNSNGEYSFFGPYTGSYMVTPSGPIPGKSYDPISRRINNITGHTSGIDFTAYNTSTDSPRKLRVVSQFAVPGSAVSVPVTVESQGNETSVSFSIEYNPVMYAGAPTVTCGTDAGPGCQITTNYSQTGRVGIRVVPANVPLAAGTRELVKLNFQTQPTLASNTPVDLIASPTNITATNANGDLLLVELFSGGLIVMQQGIEGDVANSVTGDGQLLSNDVIVMRQFAVGARTPNPSYNEFQRVDIAPAATKGDGQITSADVIQARRYVAGVNLTAPAGGPFETMAQAPPPAMLAAGDTPREVRAMPINGVAGYKVTVPVGMKTAGDEMAVGFTLEYDAARLAAPKVALAGVAPADAVLTVNDTESGRLTILIDSGTPFSAEGGQLVNVTFDVAATAPSGDTKITVRSASVSDGEANELPVASASGTVTINGANAPSVRISGRVLSPTGAGLRNAEVTITDANGTRRTVMTSTAGYYEFDDITAGREYRVSVASRRYRFQTRTVEISADLANIDFVAQE